MQDSDGSCLLNPEAGTLNITCSSDARLKTGITSTGSVLGKMMGLKIRDFIVKSSGEKTTGVIAQEVQEIMPELVSVGEDGYLTVLQVNNWKLIKAIQELKAENDSLKSRIETLETRI